MSHIIRLHDDPHEKMQKLLPWYAMGRLDTDEIARFEAHLAACEECQAELRAEGALRNHVAQLPMDVERAWAALRRRIPTPPAHNPPYKAHAAPRRSMPGARSIGWLFGAGAAGAITALGLVVAVPQLNGTEQYHALSAPSASKTGNMIVVFRPETTERDLRRMLNASGARLVDGPTSTDAYVLRVADRERSAALAKLRAERNVVLVEPIESAQ